MFLAYFLGLYTSSSYIWGRLVFPIIRYFFLTKRRSGLKSDKSAIFGEAKSITFGLLLLYNTTNIYSLTIFPPFLEQLLKRGMLW